MKIAIASSGLGHVSRGIETWARDTAEALSEKGVDVTLFSGAPCTVPGVTCLSLPCFRRYDGKARWLSEFSPGWAWRWGLKNAYGWEQWSFWRRLKPELVRGGFDILHVQDPMVAYWCNRSRRKGLVTTKEILAHGTEESPEFLRRFDYVQHLAPWHLEQARAGGSHSEYSTAIPNFVDADLFRPARDDEEKKACRRELGIPENAFVVGTAAAVKKSHKRIDYLIRECAGFLAGRERSTSNVRHSTFKDQEPAHPHTHTPAYLLIAGARQPDTDELVAMARERAGDRIRILLDVPRAKMPSFYRCLDLLALTSLFEMMPIAVLETLASGVPVVANRHAVLEWMVGQGGATVDMSKEGTLASFLDDVDDCRLAACATAARERAVTCFDKRVVIEQYVEYYAKVTGT